MGVFRSVVWLLHSVAQTGAICITILFWAALAPSATPGSLGDPFNIAIHAVNSVLFLIEVFVIAFPMRLLHFVYPMIFGIAYVIATLIFHATGITSAVYPVLDWENDPGIAAAFSVGGVVGAVIVHSGMFGLHYLRKLVAVGCRDQSEEREEMNARQAYTNSAYDLST